MLIGPLHIFFEERFIQTFCPFLNGSVFFSFYHLEAQMTFRDDVYVYYLDPGGGFISIYIMPKLIKLYTYMQFTTCPLYLNKAFLSFFFFFPFSFLRLRRAYRLFLDKKINLVLQFLTTPGRKKVSRDLLYLRSPREDP